LRYFRVVGLMCVGLASLVMGACSKDDPQVPPTEVVFPASWAGVWRVTFPYRDCTTDSLLGVDVTVDSICVGTTVEEFLGIRAEQLDVRCVGTITDTEFNAHCSGQSAAFGLEITVVADFTAARNDSVFTGGGSATLQYRSGNSTETECYAVSYDALHVAPAPPACSGTVSLAKPLARALRPRREPSQRPHP